MPVYVTFKECPLLLSTHFDNDSLPGQRPLVPSCYGYQAFASLCCQRGQCPMYHKFGIRSYKGSACSWDGWKLLLAILLLRNILRAIYSQEEEWPSHYGILRHDISWGRIEMGKFIKIRLLTSLNIPQSLSAISSFIGGWQDVLIRALRKSFSTLTVIGLFHSCLDCINIKETIQAEGNFRKTNLLKVIVLLKNMIRRGGCFGRWRFLSSKWNYANIKLQNN